MGVPEERCHRVGVTGARNGAAMAMPSAGPSREGTFAPARRSRMGHRQTGDPYAASIPSRSTGGEGLFSLAATILLCPRRQSVVPSCGGPGRAIQPVPRITGTRSPQGWRSSRDGGIGTVRMGDESRTRPSCTSTAVAPVFYTDTLNALIAEEAGEWGETVACRGGLHVPSPPSALASTASPTGVPRTPSRGERRAPPQDHREAKHQQNVPCWKHPVGKPETPSGSVRRSRKRSEWPWGRRGH